MLTFLFAGLVILALIPLSLIAYRSYQGRALYNRAVAALGKQHVVYFDRSYMTFGMLSKRNQGKAYDSMALFNAEINKNPNLKLIIISVLQSVYTIVCDPQLIRKMTTEYVDRLKKRGFLVFYGELERGLIFSEGEVWKKSRSVISTLFHFEMLKNRETVMEQSVERCIQGLQHQEVNLFKLGCTIGGEIVVESLFGKEFTDVRFGTNTPLEEIQLLITQLIHQTIHPLYIFRRIIFGKLVTDSRYLTPSQRRVRDRLVNLKRVGHEFLQREKEKQQKGLPVAPFVEAYLNLNDESYYDEVIQQLIIFLIAGQDTTGQLIEVCLYELAQRPQYQDLILKSLESEPNVHNNKTLNNFIQETNRIIGPIKLSLMRSVVEPFTIDGFEFQEGESYRMGFGAPMTNPKYFEDPWEFKPDRFNTPLSHPNAFMPFSGGRRNCIGQHMSMMEVRIALVGILKKYKLERTDVRLQMTLKALLNEPINHKLVKFVLRT